MPETPRPANTPTVNAPPINTRSAAAAEPEGLDPRGVRFTAAVTSAILAFGLLTGSWRVLAAQTALVATVGYAAGWSAVGVLANAVALFAALLEAAFGHCLGCRAHSLLRRFAAGWSAAGTGRTT